MVERIDTSLVREIAGNARGRIILLACGVVVLALALWSGSQPHQPFAAGYSMVLTVILAVAVVGQFVELIRFAGAAVTISPQGVKVAMMSPDTVPWQGLAAVEDVSLKGARLIKLSLKPDMARTLRRRWGSRFGNRFPDSELPLYTGPLRMDHAELLRLLRAYAAAFAPTTFALPSARRARPS
jgi:hypothetical protein